MPTKQPSRQVTVKLAMTTYNTLVTESKKREGRFPAPCRTARQLIEERLEELK